MPLRKKQGSARGSKGTPATETINEDSDAESDQPATQMGTQGKSKKRVHTATVAASTNSTAVSEAYNRDWSANCGLDDSGKEHVKHAFMQIIMQYQILRQEEPQEEGDHTAMSVFQEISGNTSGMTATLVDFIADVNRNIKFLELEIRRMLFPAEQAWYVALVNTTEDSPSRSLVAPYKDPPADLYNHTELAFFRALVEAIATSDEAVQAGVPVMSTTAALHLSFSAASESQAGTSQGTQGSIRDLTKSERQDVLTRLTRDKWLARDPGERGGILGPRTLMALRPWVRSLDVSEETRQEWDRTL